MDQDPETEVLEPGPPPGGGGPSPLRLGGFVLLGVAAVSAVVGLVSLAGGGENAAAAPSVKAVPTSSPTPAPPPSLAAPPVAPAPAPTTPPPGQPSAAQPPTGQPQAGQAPTGQPPAAAPTMPAPTTPAPATPAPGTPGMGNTQAPVAPTHSPGPLAAPPTTPAPHAQKPLPGAGLPDESGGTGGTGIGGGKGVAAAKAPVRVYNNSLIRELAQHAAADFRASGWKVTDVGNYPSGIIPTSTVYYRPGTEEQAAAQSLANAFGLQAQPRFPGIVDADPGLIVIVTKDYQRR